MSTTDQLPRPAPAGPSPPLPDAAASTHETVIRPTRGWIAIDWAELVHSHELFATLVLRDVKIRYKQTVLGVAWAVIQPVFTMVVFTVIFGRIVGVKTDDVPYPLFALAGAGPLDVLHQRGGRRRR